MEAERKRAVEQAGEVTGELRVRFPDVAVGKVVVGAVEVDAELRPDRCYRALQWEEHGELVV